MAEYLKSVSVSVLPQVSTIHHVHTTDTASSTLKMLMKNNILSAPILDKEKNEYIGFIDMVDLVTFLVDISQEAEILGAGFLQLFEEGARFNSTKVFELSNFSSRDPFVPVRSDASLYSVVEVLSKYQVHRVPVVDSENRVVNIVTQSAVIAYLGQHMNELGAVMSLQQTIASLNLGHKEVITVNIGDRAIDAFRAMSRHRVSAVGVVDNEHHLIANISVRDIRAISTDAHVIQRMYLPIRQFLLKMNEDKLNIMNPSIACHPTDTYATALSKLVASRVHRLYLVDDHWIPRGVLSLSDALLPLI